MKGSGAAMSRGCCLLRPTLGCVSESGMVLACKQLLAQVTAKEVLEVRNSSVGGNKGVMAVWVAGWGARRRSLLHTQCWIS